MNCKVCENTSAKNSSVSFFRFPKETTRCKDWAERCNLLNLFEKHGTLQFYKSYRICSAHFNPKDIVFDGRKKKLLPSAVPINFLINKTPIQPEVNNVNFNSNETFKLKLVENLCRLCAEENRNLTDIFGCRGKTMNLEDKLKYIPLAMNKCDVLPLRVCHQCISKVNQFYEFITNCIKAENKLRIMLEDCNTTYKIIDNFQDNIKSNLQTPGTENPSDIVKCTADNPSSNIDQEFQDNLSEPQNTNIYVLESEVKFKLSENNLIQSTQCFKLVNPVSHIKNVDFSKNISCKHDYSNMITRDQMLLQQRLQNESQDQQLIYEPTYSCDICLETFTNVNILNSHLLSHSLESNKYEEFICEICNTTFASGTSLNDHILVHANKSSFKCQICDKQFHQVAFLKQHLEISHGFATCSRSFQPTNLKTLENCLKPNPRLKQHEPHKVSLIKEAKTSSKSNNKSQKPEVGWRCQFCDKLFNNRRVCSEHEKSHGDETPYQCKECGKTFRSRPSLRQHRSVHSDKRLFSCQECGMSFKRKDTLSNHLRIHTGERPFVCKICGFAFKQRGDCIKHEKNHEKLSMEDQLLEPEINESKLNKNITRDISVGLNQTPEEVLWNEEKYTSLPPCVTIAEEITPVDSLEKIVSGRLISFDFSV